MDILEHNRIAWNSEVDKENPWTIPVSENDIEKARQGDINIVLTPHKIIPKSWLLNVAGKKILCLASGGGQQGPILAAAGANVTVLDYSEKQLERDKEVSTRFNLSLVAVKGNMQDLTVFESDCFDIIIHPVSNCFVDSIRPVWQESYRVLKKGGTLLSGFCNPILFMINWEKADKTRKCEIENKIPYSDLDTLSNDTRAKYVEEKTPFEFGHSLTDQIQGQIDAGFIISGFYEDKGEELLDQFVDSIIATKATKL